MKIGKKILDILLWPIRQEKNLFAYALIINLLITILCTQHDLGFAPISAWNYSLFESYLICCIAALLRPIRLDWLIWIVYVPLTATDIVGVFTYNTLINANVVQLIINTHWNEVRELIMSNLTNPAIAWCLPVMAAVGLLIWGVVKMVERFPNWLKTTLAIILLVLIGLSSLLQVPCYVKCVRCFLLEDTNRFGDSYYRPEPHSTIVRTAFAFAFVQAQTREVSKLCQTIQQQTVTGSRPICPTIVMIIGESFNKHRCGLYDPAWECVNPQLCALREKGDLVVYDDVISPNNITSHVMRHLFTLQAPADTAQQPVRTLMPVVFREAGWRVVMLNNQYCQQNADQWSIIGGTIFNHPDLRKAQFDWINNIRFTYDEQLLSLLPDCELRADTPTLVIFHLRGQHVDYRKRYPAEWDRFHAEDMPQNYGGATGQQIAAEYANATRYNDFIVDSIWNLFAHQDAVGIYFSDHGEEVFDWRDFYERSDESHITPEIIRYQFEVPMMVLMSDTYRKQHPEMADRINRCANRPTSIEHLAHMLFHLAGIETTVYDTERDVLSDDFDATGPRKIGNGKWKMENGKWIN